MRNILTSCFKGLGDYLTLYKAFERSVKENMPDANIICLDDQPKFPKGRTKRYQAMTARLRQWATVLPTIKGDILLADCDIVFNGDMMKVFDDYDFDIAYTKRKHRNKPINGGIIWMRDTPRARRFMQMWHEVNVKMFKDIEFHNKWKKKFRGMNQPAFGYLLKNPKKHKCKMVGLPCLKYNACDPEWAKIKDDVVAIHLKTQLRKAALKTHKAPAKWQKAFNIWLKYSKDRVISEDVNKKREGSHEDTDSDTDSSVSVLL